MADATAQSPIDAPLTSHDAVAAPATDAPSALHDAVADTGTDPCTNAPTLVVGVPLEIEGCRNGIASREVICEPNGPAALLRLPVLYDGRYSMTVRAADGSGLVPHLRSKLSAADVSRIGRRQSGAGHHIPNRFA